MTLRLETGPVNDDNRWPHCRHCAEHCPRAWHDEPCMVCHATPGPEEEA